MARAGWRCQACGRGGRLDVHHVVKRSQGGSDWDLDALVALCRRCHAQTDAPFVKGRLIVRPRGGGQFTFEVITVPCRSLPCPLGVEEGALIRRRRAAAEPLARVAPPLMSPKQP